MIGRRVVAHIIAFEFTCFVVAFSAIRSSEISYAECKSEPYARCIDSIYIMYSLFSDIINKIFKLFIQNGMRVEYRYISIVIVAILLVLIFNTLAIILYWLFKIFRGKFV